MQNPSSPSITKTRGQSLNEQSVERIVYNSVNTKIESTAENENFSSPVKKRNLLDKFIGFLKFIFKGKN
jgi:hypothetical protein